MSITQQCWASPKVQPGETKGSPSAASQPRSPLIHSHFEAPFASQWGDPRCHGGTEMYPKLRSTFYQLQPQVFLQEIFFGFTADLFFFFFIIIIVVIIIIIIIFNLGAVPTVWRCRKLPRCFLTPGTTEIIQVGKDLQDPRLQPQPIPTSTAHCPKRHIHGSGTPPGATTPRTPPPGQPYQRTTTVSGKKFLLILHAWGCTRSPSSLALMG